MVLRQPIYRHRTIAHLGYHFEVNFLCFGAWNLITTLIAIYLLMRRCSFNPPIFSCALLKPFISWLAVCGLLSSMFDLYRNSPLEGRQIVDFKRKSYPWASSYIWFVVHVKFWNCNNHMEREPESTGKYHPYIQQEIRKCRHSYTLGPELIELFFKRKGWYMEKD